MKSRARSIRSWILGGSVALHAAFAVAAVLIPKPERAETAAIELADIKKKKEPPKPPPPPPPPPQEKPKPPPPPPRAQAQAKMAADAPKAEPLAAAPASEDGFADLGGVALGNGGGGDGVAVAAATGPRPGGAGAGPAAPKAVTKKAVQQLAPAEAEACTQPMVRPRRTVGVQAKYSMQGRQAEIEGLVRIEVTVDESGKVIAARVLSGLGYGLDESALDAARKCVFEPATRCGRPVVGTAIVSERFELE